MWPLRGLAGQRQDRLADQGRLARVGLRLLVDLRQVAGAQAGVEPELVGAGVAR
jgi:hypothetical protein